MILPTGATIAVADGETVRLFHNAGVKAEVHLVEITAAPPAHLKLGFSILSDRGGRIAQRFGVRWCIPEPRNVGIEPRYYSAVGNLQGAQMILFPLITTWMWFQTFETSSIPSFVSRRRGHQHAEVSWRTVAFEGG
jgi:hypothetical protein